MPGVTVDRQCGSSQQAVSFAAASVIAGHYDVVVAGGVESMSRVPMGMSVQGQWPFGEGFRARYNGIAPNQGIGAEMIVDRWGLSPGRSWMSTASARTPRPPPRRTRAGSPARSPR